ncbi:MAG: HAMP domain-containing sensor histidine kinase [Anaerolineales bacterium]|jgi:signal transduction histidine kinase
MFRSLRTRLFLTYLLVSGLVLALVGVSLLIFILRNPYAEQLIYQRLEAVAETIIRRERPGLQVERPELLEQNLERLDEALGLRFLVLDSSGKVVADSRPSGGSPEEAFRRQLAASDGSLRDDFVDASGRRWLAIGRPVSDRYALVLALPNPKLRTLSVLGDQLLPPMLRAGALALLASALAAWLIARWVAKPLQRISQAARAVAAGDYSDRPPPTGPSEVHSLALAFSEMVQRVQSGQQSQRDFVANVSHELKTPLTSIQGFAQAILDGTAEDAEAQQHAAQVIYDESDRLRRLVDDLLELARMDTGQVQFARQPVDLQALVGNVAEKLSLPAAEKEVHLVIELPALPIVIGDGDRLAQVFTNLLDNAIKHTPAGGKVALRGNAAGGWVSVHVDDSGPGIPSEELSRIFERFYQLDKARPGGRGRGAGLGLAISREIVHAHGGRVVAQSEIGRGSRFSVQLPIVRPDDETLVRPDKPHRV